MSLDAAALEQRAGVVQRSRACSVDDGAVQGQSSVAVAGRIYAVGPGGIRLHLAECAAVASGQGG